MSLTLYHGSKNGLNGPIRPLSRSVCDFGRAFYLGDSPHQPETLICDNDSPHLYTCELDLTDLSVHAFADNLDWAMFVAWNRNRIPTEYRQFFDAKYAPLVATTDVFRGKIANDRMFVVLGWFFDDFISDAGLVEALGVLNLGNQYACISEKACRQVMVVEDRVLTPQACEILRNRAMNQREYAMGAVDRIRRFHRRNGRFFSEILEDETAGGRV